MDQTAWKSKIGLKFESLKREAVIISKSNLTIHSLHEILKFSNHFCSDTLLVIDIDEVLISTEDVILRPHADQIRNKLFTDLVEEFELKAAEIDRIKSKTFIEPTRILTEKDAATVVQSLQKLPCKVMALTACHTGTLGELNSFEAWRYHQLLNLGIDFAQKALFANNFLLSNFDDFSNPPAYYRGILFTSIRSKGEVLGHFFDKINWKPKQIVFIDDLHKNIESVASLANDLQLPFIGFHYVNQGLESQKGSEEKLAYTQLRHLFEHGRWLSQKSLG